MTKITEKNYIDIIKMEFPDFVKYWESYVNYWGDSDGGVFNMIPLEDYVIDYFITKKRLQ